VKPQEAIPAAFYLFHSYGRGGKARFISCFDRFMDIPLPIGALCAPERMTVYDFDSSQLPTAAIIAFMSQGKIFPGPLDAYFTRRWRPL
jgi:hypothetical protein